MADVQVQQMAFYWRNAKAATVNSVQVQFTMGREALYGQAGIIAYSKGQAKMRVTIREVVPIAGSTTTKDIERILEQDDIDVAFVLGGKLMRNKMAVMEAEYSSDSEKNVTTGQVVLEGKKPKITG